MLYETAPRSGAVEVVGGRYGPGGVLFAVWPLCALASALSAVAAVAHALVLSVTAVSPRSGVRIRWPVDYRQDPELLSRSQTLAVTVHVRARRC
jgi:hypothetical protein